LLRKEEGPGGLYLEKVRWQVGLRKECVWKKKVCR